MIVDDGDLSMMADYGEWSISDVASCESVGGVTKACVLLRDPLVVVCT